MNGVWYDARSENGHIITVQLTQSTNLSFLNYVYFEYLISKVINVMMRLLSASDILNPVGLWKGIKTQQTVQDKIWAFFKKEQKNN